MQVIFVGGASGVGASCLAIEIAGKWIIVDAGVRVDRKSDPLPDLALLEGKHIQAIFVTHAHADHIGSLPLVHRAFPAAPIFASRATGLLMEVMLSDALKIMNRRAVEEMEMPLYAPELVDSMLNQVRPLPVGEPVIFPQLPDVTIYASRAGHIAGAVSLAFSAAEGTLVVSGDISSTLQRTVLGALPPPVERCDMLVLESTYGARLHPNRQGEELRLAQAVADGIAQGGHILLPCFGLGRGQEILLVLQAAQEKGQVPDFPIYVDGLVRRVCTTYQLLPEALTPTLQRQIRKGYLPFHGRNIAFVRDERERERILAGPPACILSSSGMLTGGPSVWYARRLAPLANASILITGYQDEEAPGKKLLDLAEQKEHSLELEGATVPVRCRVAKYNLSAHSDGGELAAYAASLKPRMIALVHGDEEARMALRRLLVGTEVLLPENGATLTPVETRRTQKKAQAQATAVTLPDMAHGIGQGQPLTTDDLPFLWEVVRQMPAMRMVTARQLATIWYGQANEATTGDIMELLDTDYEQRHFIHQHAMQEVYRVRGQNEEGPGEFIADLIGKVLLVEIAPGSSKPVICLGIEMGARIRVQHPRGVDFVRSRYPYSAVFEVLGELPDDIEWSGREAATALDELVRAARRIRRQLPARQLAEIFQQDMQYTLADICELVGISAQALEDRLAIAKILHRNPMIFLQQASPLDGEGQALYCLAPDWQEFQEENEEVARPDQAWIQSVIETHLGQALDLYRRSIDPDTGNVTLAFHFPSVAQTRYASEIEAIAAETGVQVDVALQPHQGELVRAAQSVLPAGLSVRGVPSIFHGNELIQVKALGTATEEEIQDAQQQFHKMTGWSLALEVPGQSTPIAPLPATIQAVGTRPRLDQYHAVSKAQALLRDLPGFMKVSVDTHTFHLLPRFHFPEIAEKRYSELLARISEQTGWHVQVQQGIHQEALAVMALHVLPAGLVSQRSPSLHQGHRLVLVSCRGAARPEEIDAAAQTFKEETGWTLKIEM